MLLFATRTETGELLIGGGCIMVSLLLTAFFTLGAAMVTASQVYWFYKKLFVRDPEGKILAAQRLRSICRRDWEGVFNPHTIIFNLSWAGFFVIGLSTGNSESAEDVVFLIVMGFLPTVHLLSMVVFITIVLLQ